MRHGRRFIGIDMDAGFLNEIAQPRIEAEAEARDVAAQKTKKTDAAEDLLESLRVEVAAARG